MIDEEARLVEHHARIADDRWVMTVVRIGSVSLSSIDVTLALDELWLDVDRVGAR